MLTAQGRNLYTYMKMFVVVMVATIVMTIAALVSAQPAQAYGAFGCPTSTTTHYGVGGLHTVIYLGNYYRSGYGIYYKYKHVRSARGGGTYVYYYDKLCS